MVSNSGAGIVYTMGIDPGGTSGYAIIGVHERTIYRDSPGRIMVHKYGSATGSYSNQVLSLMQIAAQYHPLAIILESFSPRKPIRSQEYLSPVLVAARIQFCIDTHYILAPIFYQTPELAMTTATDARLKAWGLYIPGSDHIKDATRHAITFIRRAKQDQDLRTKAWGSDEDQRQRAHATNTTKVTARNQARQPATRGINRARRRLYLR